MQSEDQQKRIAGLLAKHRATGAIIGILSSHFGEDIILVLEKTLKETAQALDAPMVCMHLADGQRGELNLVAGFNLDPVQGHAWQRLKMGGISLQAQAYGHGAIQEQISSLVSCGTGGLICAPVSGNQEVVGVISLIWPKSRRTGYDPDREVFLNTVGQLLGLALEHAGLVSELVDNLNQLMRLQAQEEERNRALAGLNRDLQKANRRLEELSVTDGLTGLYNRRHFIQCLEQEISRSRRLDHPVTLIMADLDHFKQVNDQLGHQAGDQALRLFADLLSNGVRKVDTVGRYGGEEFCLVLVNCNQAAGLAVAEKLRSQFEKQSNTGVFKVLGGLSVSMGVAQLKESMGPEQLFARADHALYQAKRQGRNQVHAY